MKVKNIHNIQRHSDNDTDTTTEEEIIEPPRKTIKGKKKIIIEEIEQPIIEVKEKKKRNYVMTEARKEAFLKMREKLKEKNENKLLDKKIEASKLLLQTEHKQKKKNLKKPILEVEDSESVEEIEIVRKKKPKKKKIIIHESSSSESEEQQEEEKDIKIPDKIMKSQKNRKSSITIKEPVKSNNTPTSFFI